MDFDPPSFDPIDVIAVSDELFTSVPTVLANCSTTDVVGVPCPTVIFTDEIIGEKIKSFSTICNDCGVSGRSCSDNDNDDDKSVLIGELKLSELDVNP